MVEGAFLDMPLALSLSTSRILRMGNLCPGIPPLRSKVPHLPNSL
jgi:hypothetical protein